MAEHADREHYIPLRKSDLVELLCKDAKLAAEERDAFRQFCKLVSAVWHFEYLDLLERLKDAYAPFDPDATCRSLAEVSAELRPKKMDELFEAVVGLMERANFKRLSRKDVEAAMEGGASDWGVNMYVDFDVFERMEIFSRGEAKVTRTKTHPIFFWKKTEKEVETYQRLVLLLKLRKHKRVPENVDVDDVFLKMFKDVPKVDIEMVLPGTSLQMPWSDKWKMGGSVVGTIGYGIWNVLDDIIRGVKVLLGAAVDLAAQSAQMAAGILWGPFALLGGYAYKQWYGYSVTKQTYSKMLTESLYYQNLDNNVGVLTHVLDEAEEQECRETFLAYFYLWKYAPPEGWNAQQLDDYIEMELEGKVGLKVDFEVGDALAKLEKLGVVRQDGDRFIAVDVDEALEKVDFRWDNYFQYNKA